MAVTPDMVQLIKQLEKERSETWSAAPSPLAGLSALEAVCYCIERVRRGEIRVVDEGDMAELLMSGLDASRERLRADAAILKQLGYADAADRLRRMARKAKPAPKPASRFQAMRQVN